jgi:beta-glucosidase
MLALLALLLAACATAAPATTDPPTAESTPQLPATPAAQPSDPTTADPVEARIDALLAEMTLAEKIGQMTLVEKDSINTRDIAPLGIGGLLSGGGGSPRNNSVEGWAEMVGRFQDEALTSRLGIPLLYGVDAVHGHANLKDATIFPHAIGLGATGDADLVRRIARVTALEMAATDIRWNYAPVLAVPQDIRWGRTYEGFSDDPALVTALGSAYLLGLQDAGDGLGLASPAAVLGTPKHFIGDGATVWGTGGNDYFIDQGDMQLDEATIRALLLPPYEQAVADGALSIMASFNSWNGEKVHGQKALLTDLLKDELGFTGFIVSDWQAVDQIDPDFDQAVIAAVNAGIDMNMVPYDYQRFITSLTAAVESGAVPTARIDDAVRRILRAKFALGLFEWPTGGTEFAPMVGSPEHRALAREAVAKSLVLLQNDGDILPLDPAAPIIAVAGAGADDIGLQSGGWTITWQGQPGAITAGTTILEGIKAAAGPETQVIYNPLGNFDRLLDDGQTADVAIVVLAEAPYAEGVGDRPDLNLPTTDVALIRRAATRAETVVVVLLSGRPLIITHHLPLAGAWVAAWLPGSEGAGVADVLFGEAPFSGRLSYDWPARMADVPLPQTGAPPLFPRGYGLP